MYVKYHILEKEKLTTVKTNDTIESALNKIVNGGFLSLPVLNEDGEFVGTLRKDEIYKKYFENEYENKHDYLNNKVITVLNENYKKVNSNTSIEEASYLLSKTKVSFLPVFEDNKFIGILTPSSIFEAFYEVYGEKKGIRVALYTHDGEKKIERLVKAVRKEGGSIISIAPRPAKMMDMYKIVMRVTDCNIESLMKRLKKAGYKIDNINN